MGSCWGAGRGKKNCEEEQTVCRKIKSEFTQFDALKRQRLEKDADYKHVIKKLKTAIKPKGNAGGNKRL